MDKEGCGSEGSEGIMPPQALTILEEFPLALDLVLPLACAVGPLARLQRVGRG